MNSIAVDSINGESWVFLNNLDIAGKIQENIKELPFAANVTTKNEDIEEYNAKSNDPEEANDENESLDEEESTDEEEDVEEVLDDDENDAMDQIVLNEALVHKFKI